MYTNIISENCQLFVPLPEEVPAADFGRQIPPAIENGLNITWTKLRLGQYWGGDGECCTQFNTEELSASGHVNGNLHGQAGLPAKTLIYSAPRQHPRYTLRASPSCIVFQPRVSVSTWNYLLHVT